MSSDVGYSILTAEDVAWLLHHVTSAEVDDTDYSEFYLDEEEDVD